MKELLIEKLENAYVEDELGTKFLFDRHYFYHSKKDKPAIILNNGDRYWYKHGILHRNKKPAIIK